MFDAYIVGVRSEKLAKSEAKTVPQGSKWHIFFLLWSNRDVTNDDDDVEVVQSAKSTPHITMLKAECWANECWNKAPTKWVDVDAHEYLNNDSNNNSSPILSLMNVIHQILFDVQTCALKNMKVVARIE